VVLVGRGMAGASGSAESRATAAMGAAAAARRWLGAAVSGLRSFSGARGFRSRGWLGSREDRGGAPRGGRGRRRSWRATAALDAVGGPAWRLQQGGE